ncbi:hypothetical protein MLD63_03890 [Paracoccus sp. TK19116]|uniref:Uncharacterized protein n=1 Tax=Paracoccus albicereus TaxID=2922394 RepID=A0ABT1MMS6_9RHOB|nr:hypothetical protein [Paracoccus albicereus]
MLDSQRKAMRASVSGEDLRLILRAVEAYGHNKDYRELIDRLQHQASALGVKTKRVTAH